MKCLRKSNIAESSITYSSFETVKFNLGLLTALKEKMEDELTSSEPPEIVRRKAVDVNQILDATKAEANRSEPIRTELRRNDSSLAKLLFGE